MLHRVWELRLRQGAPPAAASPPKAAATATPGASITKPVAVPHIANIKITGAVLESPASFSLFAMNDKNKTLREWLARLAKARQDDQVAGVALELDDAAISWSQAQELADSVRRLREVKPVYAYICSGGISHYVLLSSATELAMEPAGEIDILGIAAEMTFFRGTLDKLGIEPQMIQIGKYKGASEPMMLKEPSEELKGEYNKVLDDLYGQLVSQIANNRKLKAQDVRDAIDEGPFDSKLAMRHRLVDKLMERAKWENHIAEKTVGAGNKYVWVSNYGQEPKKQLDLSNPFALLGSLLSRPTAEQPAGPITAIVYAQGTIISGQSGEGMLGGNMIGDQTLVKALNEAAANDKVKAVVIRISSPGGSALASEMIYQAIRNCASKKPVVASIAGMGASGGYYIALGVPKIIADSTALVGSIGVISGKLALDIPRTADGKEGIYQKLGISTFAFTRGKNAGLEALPAVDGAGNGDHAAARPERVRAVHRAGCRLARRPRAGGCRRGTGADLHGRTGQGARPGGSDRRAEGSRGRLRDAAHITGGSIITLPRAKTLSDLLTGDDESDSASPFEDEDARILRRVVPDCDGAAYLLNLCRQMQRQRILLALPYYVEFKN